MGYGLRIWDASGNLMLDTNDRCATILGIFSTGVNTSFYSGSFAHGDFARGTPFYALVDLPVDNWLSTGLTTHISFSGTTCYWSVDPSIYGGGAPDQSGTLTFYYGYY